MVAPMHAPGQVIDAAATAAPTPAQAGLYAEQQAKGFGRLRFSPSLEREYRRHMRQEQRISTLICSATALAIWLAFMALDLWRLDLPHELAERHYDVWITVTLRLIVLSILLLLIQRLGSRGLAADKAAPPDYPWLSFLALVLIGTSSATSANVMKLRDLAHADMAQFVIIIAVFLPVGMTFRQSLGAATLIAGATALLGGVMLDPGHMREHIRLSTLVFFAVFVGAVGAYLREYAQRDQFLLRRLLHHYAMFDALTGIGNRRFFEQHAATALLQAQRGGEGVVLAILDVDHFKKFNDRYGHQTGDLALSLVARSLKAGLRRPMDLAARLGGEEFGLLLYGTGPEQAQVLLDSIVAAIVELAIPHDSSATAPHLTVSIGAACFDGRETLESLYRRADAVLYESKTGGRNRAGLDWPRSVVALASRRPQTQRRR
jgi:diguanylate cyclase (GGDEF)-like protein